MVSVGWQWASTMARCQGKGSSALAAGCDACDDASSCWPSVPCWHIAGCEGVGAVGCEVRAPRGSAAAMRSQVGEAKGDGRRTNPDRQLRELAATK